MPSAPRRQVPVFGVCPNGHEVHTEAAAGRVTWRGKCPHEGCEYEVLAKRVPTTSRGKAGAAGVRQAGPRLRKAVYADETPPPKFEPVDDQERSQLNREGGDEHTADALGLGAAARRLDDSDADAALSDTGAGAGPDDAAAALGAGTGRPAAGGWWSRRRQRRRADHGGEIFPGIY